MEASKVIGGTPTSSILDWDFPKYKQSSDKGVPKYHGNHPAFSAKTSESASRFPDLQVRVVPGVINSWATCCSA